MTGRLLIFQAGGVSVAVPLDQVSEVLEPPPFFPIPFAPECMDRAIHAGGSLVPVLDAGIYLGRAASLRSGRVLVLAGEGISLALQVDRVEDLISVDAVLTELPASGELFSAHLCLPTGEMPLLSPRKLVQKIERGLAERGGEIEC